MDADFYTMKYFDDKFSNKNFFEIQRLAYPFLVGGIPSDNKIVYTLLSNYADRIKDDSLEKKLDNFIDSDEKYILDCREIEDALKELSFNDLMYYNDLADVSIYKGRYGCVCNNVKYNYYGSAFQTNIITEDGLPYAHHNYDLVLKDFLKMIDLEKNYRFAEAILNKYGIFNVRNFSYDDFVRLMTSMAIKFNDNYDLNSASFKSSDYSRLFQSLSDIVSIYDNYSLNYHLNKICLKKLSMDKLTELNGVLNLASDLLKYGDKDLAFSAFMLIKNSDVVIDMRRLDEAISICENNDVKNIGLVKKEVMVEISDRRKKNISFEKVDGFIDDVISDDNSKILKK